MPINSRRVLHTWTLQSAFLGFTKEYKEGYVVLNHLVLIFKLHFLFSFEKLKAEINHIRDIEGDSCKPRGSSLKKFTKNGKD